MKRLFFFFTPMALILALAACGNASSSGGYTTGSAPTTAPTTAPATSGSAVGTASATVSGKTVMLLTNAQGMTLYYFKPDTTTTSACTADCASTWPPVLSTSTPSSTASLPGTLAVQSNTNGQQIMYNGHPLYTFTGDKSPGQTNGEGIGNKWFVATADLAMNGSSGGSATPTTQPYKNGY
ncbi:MAG TPA: hypothetical protein VKR06_39630 [Ktedonosporobacter sp.]|nr:hypothetical protein [Ktedonosporobacter sp.]